MECVCKLYKYEKIKNNGVPALATEKKQQNGHKLICRHLVDVVT